MLYKSSSLVNMLDLPRNALKFNMEIIMCIYKLSYHVVNSLLILCGV